MNALLNPTDIALLERLGWVLLNSLWQISGLACLLAFMRPYIQQASVRYWLSYATLLAMVLVPLATFVQLAPNSSPALLTAESTTPRETLPLGSKPTNSASSPEPIRNSKARLSTMPSDAPNVPAGQVAETHEASAKSAWLRVSWQGMIPAMGLIWIIGVCVALLRPVHGLVHSFHLRKMSIRSDDRLLLASLARLQRHFRVERSVELAYSKSIGTPITVGWLRPLILLPTCLIGELTPAQVDAVLAHELAHIRRLDFVHNALQTVIESLLFFHPLAWWVSRQIRIERENCCDDEAVRALGDERQFVTTLVRIEELRHTPRQWNLAMIGNGSTRDRVRRILGRKVDNHRPPTTLSLATLALVLLFLFGGVIHERYTTAKLATAAPPTEGTAVVVDWSHELEYEAPTDTPGSRFHVKIDKRGVAQFSLAHNEHQVRLELTSLTLERLNKLLQELPDDDHGTKIASPDSPQAILRLLGGTPRARHWQADSKQHQACTQFFWDIYRHGLIHYRLAHAKQEVALRLALLDLNQQLSDTLAKARLSRPRPTFAFATLTPQLDRLAEHGDEIVRWRVSLARRAISLLPQSYPDIELTPDQQQRIDWPTTPSFSQLSMTIGTKSIRVSGDGWLTLLEQETLVGRAVYGERTVRLTSEELDSLVRSLQATGYLTDIKRDMQSGYGRTLFVRRDGPSLRVQLVNARAGSALYGLIEKLDRLVDREYKRLPRIPWQTDSQEQFEQALASGRPVLRYHFVSHIAHLIHSAKGPASERVVKLIKEHDILCLNTTHRTSPWSTTSTGHNSKAADGLSLFVPQRKEWLYLDTCSSDALEAALLRCFVKADGPVDIGGADFVAHAMSDAKKISDFSFQVLTESDWVMPQQAGGKRALPIKLVVSNQGQGARHFPRAGSMVPVLINEEGQRFTIDGSWQYPDDVLVKGRNSGGIYFFAYLEKDGAGKVRFRYVDGSNQHPRSAPIAPGRYRFQFQLRPSPVQKPNDGAVEHKETWSGQGLTGPIEVTIHTHDSVRRSRAVTGWSP